MRETLTETFGMAEAGKTRYSFFFQFSKDEQSLFLSEISFVFVFFLLSTVDFISSPILGKNHYEEKTIKLWKV